MFMRYIASLLLSLLLTAIAPFAVGQSQTTMNNVDDQEVFLMNRGTRMLRKRSSINRGTWKMKENTLINRGTWKMRARSSISGNEWPESLCDRMILRLRPTARPGPGADRTAISIFDGLFKSGRTRRE